MVVLFEKCNFSASFYIEKCNWAETAAKIYIFLMLHKSFFRFLRLYKQNSIKKTNIKPMSDEQRTAD